MKNDRRSCPYTSLGLCLWPIVAHCRAVGTPQGRGTDPDCALDRGRRRGFHVPDTVRVGGIESSVRRNGVRGLRVVGCRRDAPLDCRTERRGSLHPRVVLPVWADDFIDVELAGSRRVAASVAWHHRVANDPRSGLRGCLLDADVWCAVGNHLLRHLCFLPRCRRVATRRLASRTYRQVASGSGPLDSHRRARPESQFR